MRFVDLKTQYERLHGSINKRIQAVLDHGQYILGAEVAELAPQRRREFIVYIDFRSYRRDKLARHGEDCARANLKPQGAGVC